MLTVIFGAGASYDIERSVPIPRRLPLVKDLFVQSDDLKESINRAPKCRAIIDRLRTAQRNDPNLNLESELALIAEESLGDEEVRIQLAALRFYIQDAVSNRQLMVEEITAGISNYTTLLRKLGVWRSANNDSIALTTFNYDTIIDRAVEDQVGTISLLGHYCLDQYIENDAWKLFKLHGSCHWHRVVPHTVGKGVPTSVDIAVRNAAAIDLQSGQIVDWLPERLDDEIAFPAIAVPTTRKTTFECPPGHIESFRECLSATSHLLLIGWKAGEPHAVELLHEYLPASASISIVDVDPGIDMVRKNLGSEWLRGRTVRRYRHGFSSFVRNEIEEWTQLL